MYQNSPIEVAIATGNPVSQAGIEEALEKFENFYEDVFTKVRHECDIVALGIRRA